MVKLYHMRQQLTKYAIYAAAFLAVAYPLAVRFSNTGLPKTGNITSNLFPVFGIIAFVLLWLHSMCGVFEPWLRRHIAFDEFIHYTSIMILVSIILHPLLFLVSMSFNINDIFSVYDANYIRLGIIGWFLLITYDVGKALKRYDFFVRHWQSILLISTIGFLLTFFHSLGIGSDLQENPLRAIWIFYGVTAIAGTIYTYGIKRFFKQ
jgi:LPXTG-motif cell wall-anchored protein